MMEIEMEMNGDGDGPKRSGTEKASKPGGNRGDDGAIRRFLLIDWGVVMGAIQLASLGHQSTWKTREPGDLG